MAKMQTLLTALATPANDIYTRLYLGLLTPKDDILLEKGGVRGLKVYQEIERDAHAFSVLQKRKVAPLNHAWDIEPASPLRRDKKNAAMVKSALEQMQVDRLCLELNDAILKGYAVAEIMWAIVGGLVLPAEARMVDQRRIRFASHPDQPTGFTVRLLTFDQPLQGIEVPDRKFVVHTFGSVDGNPYGIGLGQKLYWPAWFKRNLADLWLRHCERFASPTLGAGYLHGTNDDEQEKLLQRLVDVKALGAMVYPQGTDVNAITTPTSGDAYERSIRYWDEEMSKAVLGETLTTTMGTGVGSYAASKTHNEVRLELASSDADKLCDTLNRTLVRWIMELNAPGAPMPRMVRHVREAVDLKAEAEKDGLLVAAGFRPTAERIEEVYGPGYEPVPPEPAPLPSPGGSDSSTAFAEGSDTTSLITQRAMDQASLKKTMDPIHKIVKKAKSLEDMRSQLDHAYPTLNAKDFTELMGEAFAVAHAMGRFDVLAEAGLQAEPIQKSA